MTKFIFVIIVIVAGGIHCAPFYQIRSYKTLDLFPITHFDLSQITSLDTITYAPSASLPDFNQMKTVRVNFHFIYDQEGLGNLPQEMTHEYIRNVIENMNERIMRNAKMNLPLGNNTPVLPGYFQAELHMISKDEPAIYYHYDDGHYWGLQFGKHRNNYSRSTYEKYKIDEDSIFNIFIQSFPKDSLINNSEALKSNGISFKNHIKLIGIYEPVYDKDGVFVEGKIKKYWDTSRLLQHELGHTFGLSHAYTRSDGCEDTPVNPNCWNRTQNGSVCDSLWSNNLMDGNTHQIAMTPCQLAKIHFNINKETSQVKKFIKKDWCHLDNENSNFNISGNILINGEKDFNRNIVIEKDATLVLRSRLAMPAHSFILIKAGGTLILDGARIHNSCGLPWNGIKIEELTHVKGTLIVINESKIENSTSSYY